MLDAALVALIWFGCGFLTAVAIGILKGILK